MKKEFREIQDVRLGIGGFDGVAGRLTTHAVDRLAGTKRYFNIIRPDRDGGNRYSFDDIKELLRKDLISVKGGAIDLTEEKPVIYVMTATTMYVFKNDAGKLIMITAIDVDHIDDPTKKIAKAKFVIERHTRRRIKNKLDVTQNRDMRDEIKRLHAQLELYDRQIKLGLHQKRGYLEKLGKKIGRS